MRPAMRSAVFEAGIFVRRRFDRGRATLLNYHRFAPEDVAGFRWQCEYLAKHARVISMSDCADCLRGRRPLPAHAAVITVDDGHRDFYTCAYPVLREFGLPAVMYLPTAFLDGAWLWFDRYQYVFDRSPLDGAQLRAMAPLRDATLDLGSDAGRAQAFSDVARQAQWLPAEERDRLGGRLAELLRVEIPERPPEEFAPLAWDEIREMARHGIEFGGHTVTHPILRTVATAEGLEQEIRGCKDRIEQELGGPLQHFAYPSGKAEEISKAAKDAVARAGFATAVTTVLGQARLGDDPLGLRRVGVDPSVDTLWFRCCVAGGSNGIKWRKPEESF